MDSDTAEIDGSLSELEERLARYPKDRYPVQHATARFHLGVALTNLGQLDRAEEHLVVAVDLYDRDALPKEHAIATNALGAVFRLQGRSEEATRAFLTAGDLFEKVGARLEQGAASFNRGLALRELGDLEGSSDSFARAIAVLDAHQVPAQAAAAQRERAATLLTAGSLEDAAEAANAARELAERAEDLAGLGAAANILGLVRLAEGRVGDATACFRDAVGANPRSLRPEGFAMAKTNLALALERAGDPARARLAALQALTVSALPGPVATQARSVIDRLGREPGDVLVVLDTEPSEGWSGVVRDELARWAAGPDRESKEEAGAWIDGQLRRETRAEELAVALVGGLLELPSEDLATVAGNIVDALAERDAGVRAAFQSQFACALARFHIPQWTRLRDLLNRISEERGQEPSWS